MSSYQKSLSGKQCIGSCVLPNEKVKHPQTFNIVTHNKKPFCPVKVEKAGDPEIAECEGPNYDQTLWIEKPFDSEIFLKHYYGLTSFHECVDWVTQNSNKSLYTRIRIMNCAWKAFNSKNKDLVITDDLVNFYMIISKQMWLNHLQSYFNEKDSKSYLNNSFIYNFLESFSKKQNNIDGMINFDDYMLNEFTDYITLKFK